MPAEINISAPMMYSDGILSLLFLKAGKKRTIEGNGDKLEFM